MHPDFTARGLLRLPGAINGDVISELRQELWSEIGDRFGIRRDAPETWFENANKPAGDFRGRRLSGMNPIMNGLRESGIIDALEASLGRAVLEALAPTSFRVKSHWYSLLSFPGEPREWNVPHKSWHADEPAAFGYPHPWTVFAFVFLAPVSQRGGGGTVVVSGSHRCSAHLAREHGQVEPSLMDAFAEDHQELGLPKDLRVIGPTNALGTLTQADPWFKELTTAGDAAERIEQYTERGHSFQDIPVKVVELSGAPGDVILMDPRCLHSISVNNSGRPREILRLDFRREPG